MIGTTIQHYRITDRLGAGGMGEVYRAEDVRLGRTVALKFLPPAFRADAESRARLLNEARAASVLRSPNIAITYDIGEYGGGAFIVMEYVEGELLSSRIARATLAVREATDVGIQVAEALEEAHAHGIVHRDIKSANLIATPRGVVKVLDFGLAKFAEARADLAATQPQVTAAGLVLGTVAYMSPEQALGHPVDGRSDLFSLGIVLFEAVTGRLPFDGRTPTEIIDQVLHADPLPPSRLNAAVPAGFDTIVARALEKPVDRRYQTATEFGRELRALARNFDGVTRPPTSRTTPAAALRPSYAVAVMTFANITREPADDWIGSGIAETVSADLKNVRGLTIIGRARVFDALRHLSAAAHELDDRHGIDIGRRLGATWVVVGAYQRLGTRLRITASFVVVETGEQRGTVKVDGPIEEIFDLQDRIVYELTQKLNLELRGSDIAEIEAAETQSVEAYESYARGMLNLRLATRDSLDRAIDAFEQAVGRDPSYAKAWAALGGAYGLKSSFLGLRDLAQRAIDLETRALRLDPQLADAHFWMGAARLGLGDTPGAIAALREGLRLEPENAQGHASLGRALWVGQADFPAAIAALEQAIALNPEAGYAWLQVALLYAWEGRFAEAETACRRAVDLQEQAASGSAGLQIVGAYARSGYVQYLQGRYDAAIQAYEREMAFISSSDHALRERELIELNVKLGAVYLRKEDAGTAGQFLARALSSFDARVANGADDPFTRYYIACAHALLGDAARALDDLQRVTRALPALTAVRAARDPDLASLRNDARFRIVIGAAA
ncbi:MAG TPA: protein kinase [Vicinamibacterales bacterium]|nr:protein kinase [Vicinamibacterales bacterium]